MQEGTISIYGIPVYLRILVARVPAKNNHAPFSDSRMITLYTECVSQTLILIIYKRRLSKSGGRSSSGQSRTQGSGNGFGMGKGQHCQLWR